MRERGAKLADIAILVVDGTRGVQPQTITSYRYLEEAKIPIVVAITKADRK
jgi:translation initiation factor IF-2